VAFVRRKRVNPYEYHQLVENRWMGGKPCQSVFLHLGRHTTVGGRPEGWPKEVEGLRGSSASDGTRPTGSKRELRLSGVEEPR
jgi:hypothetical protein